jgi:hypothetical protein
MRNKKQIWIVLLILCLVPTKAAWAQYSSTNYKVEETYFGTGGEVDATSASYRAQQGTGALGVGRTNSTNYSAEAGFITPNEPFLEMTVSGATVDFGTLSDTIPHYGSAQAGACNCSFTVRSYMSSQYVVVTMSNPPTNESGNIWTAKSTQAAASGSTGVEEFGMNLRGGNTGGAAGADPVASPDSTFAIGSYVSAYGTIDQYKYGLGDTIAQSASSVSPNIGQTNYTITYEIKANSITKAGLYVMRHDLVALATY